MRGHTLIELLFVLMLTGAAAASLAPTARGYRDRASVVAAREAVAGLLAEARVAAVEAGGASVRITVDPPMAVAVRADSTLRSVALGVEFGVALRLSGGISQVELGYNALGLGRVASQTVDLVRGGASAGLVVSSYGRVRRR